MNIAIVGCHGHWRYVLAGLRPGTDAVVAVAPGGPDEDMSEVAAECAACGQTPSQIGEYRAALDSPDVELAVATPRFDRTAAVVVAAMERGLPCFAEKPVALTLDDLATVRSAWSAANALLYPIMAMRCEPAFRAAKAAVERGAIGTPRLISAQKSYRLGERPAFYRERGQMGGLIPWVGSHVVDLVRWYTGDTFRSVFAAHSRRHNRDFGDLETTAIAQFTMSEEVSAIVQLDYLRPEGAVSHGDDRIRIAGTRGVVEVCDDTAVLIDANDTIVLPPEAPRTVFRDFLETVEGRGTGQVPAEDAFIVTEACIYARISADEGRMVSS